MIRGGRVTDDDTGDTRVEGVRAYLAKAAEDPRIQTTVLQTVGAKGYDGLAFSRVL